MYIWIPDMLSEKDTPDGRIKNARIELFQVRDELARWVNSAVDCYYSCWMSYTTSNTAIR
jgi:hypothetical protein